MMKRLRRNIVEDLGLEFNEVVNRLDSGRDSKSLEKSFGTSGGVANTNIFWSEVNV